jgi:hypothetical protein
MVCVQPKIKGLVAVTYCFIQNLILHNQLQFVSFLIFLV